MSSAPPTPTTALANDWFKGALVPEHSLPFMEAMSGGTGFQVGDYLFYAADDWLMAIGYPLCGGSAPLETTLSSEQLATNALAFEEALGLALARTGPLDCWAIAPALPGRLTGYEEETDRFFILPADAQVPKPLRRPIARAAERLTVTEERSFTPEHRRLWAEFLDRVPMKPRVRALYARTEAVLAGIQNQNQKAGVKAADLRLLGARDEQGRLTACLLLDYSPEGFCSYIIGAHSRRHYAPHATDLLFAAMLERCRAEGKKYAHLGLGVNPGIERFKRKWGGAPSLPYRMASWREEARPSRADDTIAEILRGLLAPPPELSKRQFMETLPKQRPFAMIWEVRKGDAVSYLCGTAHFFCYSFELSFRSLFEHLDTIIFEGPLSEAFLMDVEAIGRNPAPGTPCLLDALEERDIAVLERMIYGRQDAVSRFLGFARAPGLNVRHTLAHTRPWFAFFSLWTAFLERKGWNQSVDLEAWHTALDMGKAVIGMESLEEQMASLESVPFGRIIDFLRRAPEWPGYMRRNIGAYLNGDLIRMMGSSIEFPSRTEQVIDFRDQRFRERMRPFLDAGSCAVFVGSAHLLNLRRMLREDGFSVRQYRPGLRFKIRDLLRGGPPEDPL